jgi:CheY-like chemotaxis protein
VRAHALAAGAIAVLSKPCREADLLHAIDVALTQS